MSCCPAAGARRISPGSPAATCCACCAGRRRRPGRSQPAAARPGPGSATREPTAPPDPTGPASAEMRLRLVLRDVVQVHVHLLVVETRQPGDLLALRQRGAVDPDQVSVQALGAVPLP